MVLSTSELRKEYGPPCEDKAAAGAQEAWDAQQEMMRHHEYKLRVGDTGSRSCRPITGGKGYSLHAYFLLAVLIHLWNLAKAIAAAVACDFNWNTNPYGSHLVTDMSREMVDAICAIRTKSGTQVFRWGGYYQGNKDAMHYEIVCSKADLATGIDWTTVQGHTSDPEEDDVTLDELDKALEPIKQQLAALDQRVASQFGNGMFDFAPEGGDTNVVWLEPQKDGIGTLVQLVYVGAPEKQPWEERVLQIGCRLGTLAWLNPRQGGRRLDLAVQLVDGDRVSLVYDPDNAGPLPGGWRSSVIRAHTASTS